MANRWGNCGNSDRLYFGVRMGIPDHLIYLLRNLYGNQEGTVRMGHGTTDWFKTGKGVHQDCILSSCLFNLYAESVCVLSCSVVSDFLQPTLPTRLLYPWEFSRQEYWTGLPCPPPGDLPKPGIKPRSPTLEVDLLLSEPPGKCEIHISPCEMPGWMNHK